VLDADSSWSSSQVIVTTPTDATSKNTVWINVGLASTALVATPTSKIIVDLTLGPPSTFVTSGSSSTEPDAGSQQEAGSTTAEDGSGACLGGPSDAGPLAPSCAPGGPGMTNCGACNENCCTSLEVEGGTYYRTYTNSGDGGTALADPATVSSFRLDKYDVTVGRFRQFVNAVLPSDGGVGWGPDAGSGKHTYLNNGNGLNATRGGYEPGWIALGLEIETVNENLALGTWTPSPSSQENLPITFANWYEAYAFCIWDGGFLPSEAEWEYAAAGGSQQREYPWGSTAPGIDNQYAIYSCSYPSHGGLGNCQGPLPGMADPSIAPVGTAALGAGLWGQLDLAGEIFQWNLDWYASYADCTDCTNVTTANQRVVRGSRYDGPLVLPSGRGENLPVAREGNLGFRCSNPIIRLNLRRGCDQRWGCRMHILSGCGNARSGRINREKVATT
jgi:formylglycine-generating enzyme